MGHWGGVLFFSIVVKVLQFESSPNEGGNVSNSLMCVQLVTCSVRHRDKSYSRFCAYNGGDHGCFTQASSGGSFVQVSSDKQPLQILATASYGYYYVDQDAFIFSQAN